MTLDLSFSKCTSRFLIRPYSSNDYLLWTEAIQRMLEPQNQFDLKKAMANEMSEEKFDDLVTSKQKMFLEDRSYDLLVFDKQNSLVGFLSLMAIVRSYTQQAFLGYRVFDNYWGQGFAKEFIAAGFEIAFDKLKLHRLEAAIEEDNDRSIRLAESLGMRREGLARKKVNSRSGWRDMLIYAILETEAGYPEVKI